MPLARSHALRRTGVAVVAVASIVTATLASTGTDHDPSSHLDAAASPRLDIEASASAASTAQAPLRSVPVRADRRARIALTGTDSSLPTAETDTGVLPDLSVADDDETPVDPSQADATPIPAEPAATAPAWVRPGTGRFSSGFAKRWGRMHKGIDLAAPIGAPIYAAANGTVIFAGPASGFGRLVKVRHADGVETWYGHMSKILVEQGQQVKAGELIAKVGNEGKSTGPHLHFEVHVRGNAVDPVPYLKARGVSI